MNPIRRQFSAMALVFLISVPSGSVFSQTTDVGSPDAADTLASVIDRRIAEVWEQNRIKPAPLTDDPEYLRRTYLNIVGRIPSVNEVLEFLEDNLPDKRRRLV